MIYPRKIQPQLLRNLSNPQILMLTGMRRVGKTTLCQSIFDQIKSDNKVFLDLENPLTQRVFEEKNYDNIIANLREFGIHAKKKAYIFLDEIQVMPEISKAIKYLYDHYGFKFVLTGSSSFYLKRLFPESLAGRKFVFELYPLDFEEFLTFKNKKREYHRTFRDKDQHKTPVRYELLKNFYEEYMQYGGFPQVVLEENRTQKRKHLDDIFKSYFEKDVQSLAKFREIQLFRDLLLLLMSRCGNKLDISRLASELGTSRETIYSYLSFLESTYFISLIPPFTQSIDKSVSKAKKVYFCDCGIVNAFSKISEGTLFENSVFNNLRGQGQIQYYQKGSGKEIDFILNAKVALEAKWLGTARDLKELKTMTQKISLKEYYVITQKFVEDKGFIPAVDL